MNNKELLHHYAGIALESLIKKLPLYDKDGEFGIKATEDDVSEIKKGIAESAFAYAKWMLFYKEDAEYYAEHLKERL